MNKKILLSALILLAVSGLMLHYRIHNFMVEDKANPGIFFFDRTRFLSFIFPMLDVVLVTALFMSRKTAVYGFLLNGMIVILGTVLMTHYSIAFFIAKAIPPEQWLLNSTLPDIGIAWGDFFVGKALYDLHMRSNTLLNI